MLSSKSPHSTILLNNLSVQFSLLKIIYYCTHKCMIHVAGAHVLWHTYGGQRMTVGSVQLCSPAQTLSTL